MSKYKVVDSCERENTIAYAVSDALLDRSYHKTSKNIAESIGILVEILVDKGVLTKEDIRKFVGLCDVVEVE